MLSTIKVNSNLAKFIIMSRPLRGVRWASDVNTLNERYVLESGESAERAWIEDDCAESCQYAGHELSVASVPRISRLPRFALSARKLNVESCEP